MSEETLKLARERRDVGKITRQIRDSVGLELHCKAQDWLAALPDNHLYKNGAVFYPPRGQGDIATLMAAFAIEVARDCAEIADELEDQWVGAGPTISAAIRAKFGIPA